MSAFSAIIVTGSDGVLGRAITEAGLQRGWTVIASTRSLRNPFPQCDQLVHVPGVDLATMSGAHSLADTTRTQLAGQPFAVANCVGSFPGFRAITEIDGDQADAIYRSNFLTVYNTAHVLLPLMCERRRGHFIAFTSHSRFQAFPFMAAFDAAKAALTQLVKHIANEASSDGVAANALALATVLSEAERKLKPHGDHGAWLRPEQVADLVFWLLAAPNIDVNGNEIHLFNYSASYFQQSYFERIQPNDGTAD